MACRDAYRTKTMNDKVAMNQSVIAGTNTIKRLLFGVDSKTPSNDLLQNNLDQFEWATRNKIYPNFWGRNIVGENRLTKEEIAFLHDRGCKVTATYSTSEEKKTEEQGAILAKKIGLAALELAIPAGAAIFLELGESERVSNDFMWGFANALMLEGYTPGFKANTDARFSFDREFSIGMQTDQAVFAKCLIWAVSPSLAEYERMTTSHLIHPDNWTPFAPSGITRNEIAIWQYGKDCHPIHNDAGEETTFNLNLVRNEQVIIDKMF